MTDCLNKRKEGVIMAKQEKTNEVTGIVNDFSMDVFVRTSMNAEDKENGDTTEKTVRFNFIGFTLDELKKWLVAGQSPRVRFQSECRKNGSIPDEWNVPKPGETSIGGLTKAELKAIEKLKKRHPEKAVELDEMLSKK